MYMPRACPPVQLWEEISIAAALSSAFVQLGSRLYAASGADSGTLYLPYSLLFSSSSSSSLFFFLKCPSLISDLRRNYFGRKMRLGDADATYGSVVVVVVGSTSR